MESEPREARGKKDPTATVKVRRETAQKLADIAEAKGWHLWQVVEDLLTATLDAEWKAVQRKLKAIRELKAKAQAIQAEARKASAD